MVINADTAHWAYADKYLKNPMKCTICKRVCAFVEDDGVCGSPVCRKQI